MGLSEESIYEVALLVFDRFTEEELLKLTANDGVRVCKSWATAITHSIAIKCELENEQAKAVLFAILGKNLFITGGAGTGKSHVTCLLEQYLSQLARRCIVCAPTNLAAVNIGGSTIQSVFGFYFQLVPDCRIGLYPDVWMNDYSPSDMDLKSPSCTSNGSISNRLKVLRKYSEEDMTKFTQDIEDDFETDNFNNDSIMFVPLNIRMMRSIKNAEQKYYQLAFMEVLIIDEVSMLSDPLLHNMRAQLLVAQQLVYTQCVHVLEANDTPIVGKLEQKLNALLSLEPLEKIQTLKRRLQRALHTQNPFDGAVQVIMIGDFAQLPPIYNGVTKDVVKQNRFHEYAFESRVWKECIKPIAVELLVSKRTVHPEYASLQARMRKGETTQLVEWLNITRRSMGPNPFEQMRTNNSPSNEIQLDETLAIFSLRKPKQTQYGKHNKHNKHNKHTQPTQSLTQQRCTPCVNNWNSLIYKHCEGAVHELATERSVNYISISDDQEEEERDSQDGGLSSTKERCFVDWETTTLMTQYVEGKLEILPRPISLKAGSIIQITKQVLNQYFEVVAVRGMLATFNGLTTPHAGVQLEFNVTSTNAHTIELPRSAEHKHRLIRPTSQILANHNASKRHKNTTGASTSRSRSRGLHAKVSFTDCQYPIKPANALTAHGAQGQTIHMRFAVYMNDIFQCGQKYVMLSRASDPSLMRLDCDDWDERYVDWETRIKCAQGKVVKPQIHHKVLAFHKQISTQSKRHFLRHATPLAGGG